MSIHIIQLFFLAVSSRLKNKKLLVSCCPSCFCFSRLSVPNLDLHGFQGKAKTAEDELWDSLNPDASKKEDVSAGVSALKIAQDAAKEKVAAPARARAPAPAPAPASREQVETRKGMLP